MRGGPRGRTHDDDTPDINGSGPTDDVGSGPLPNTPGKPSISGPSTGGPAGGAGSGAAAAPEAAAAVAVWSIWRRLRSTGRTAIAIAVLGFNLLGDGLRDRFDPRLVNAG